MKKRVIAALMALVLIVGLVPTVVPTAQAAGITATITTSTTVGGYERGNSYGKASMSNDLRDCKWICMEPAGNPPIKGHRFRIESVKGLYRTFAWMAENTTNEDRLYNIHHCVAELNGTNNGTFFPEQQKVYKEAQNYDTSRIPDDFVAFRGIPTTDSNDQICLFWGRNPVGKVTLKKTSSDTHTTSGNSAYSLSGAKYGIYHSESDARANRNRITSLTTTSSGSSNTVTLSAGKYYYREITAPKGYELDTTVRSVTVESGRTVTIHASDKPIRGHIIIKKESSNPDVTNGNNCYSLVGAQYSFYRSSTDAKADKNRVTTITIRSGGSSYENSMPLGKYYYKETKVPKGYALDTTVRSFTLTSSKTLTIRVKDIPEMDPAPVMVQKQTSDGTGGKPLPGAEFTFRYYDGFYNTVEEAEASGKPTRSWVFKTDKTGKARFEQKFLIAGDKLYLDEIGFPGIPYGTLLIQETKAPEGYIIDPTVRLEQIKDETTGGGTTPTLNAPIIPNTRLGRLVVEKTAINGSAEGWNFEVYDSTGKLLETITTGKDGKAYSSYLDEGTYTVREVHDKSDQYWVYDVEADKTAEVVIDQDSIVKYTNEQFGKAEIIKKIKDGNGPLGGWTFHITGGPDNVDLTLTTNDDGTITTDQLRPGKYMIEELLPEDSGYTCETAPQEITVEAGKTVQVTFTNAMRPGKIQITKLASDTAQPLSGVKMCLEWSADDGQTWQPVFYSEKFVKGGCSNPNIVDGCLVTAEDGVLTWENLYSGSDVRYRLTEVETQEGYQLLSGVAWEGTLPTDTLEVALNVVNSPVFMLPPTGRFGIWPYIAIGVVLLSAAAGVAVKAKKHKEEK